MAVPPVNATGATTTSSVNMEPSKRNVGGAAGDTGGDNAFAKFLDGANSQQIQADQAMQQLATGEAPSMHNVVLSTAKADLSFRLLLEMRNKLIESYQEIMRMQV